MKNISTIKSKVGVIVPHGVLFRGSITEKDTLTKVSIIIAQLVEELQKGK